MVLVGTAWLLRSARAYTPTSRGMTAARFAQGDDVYPAVHRSQVSRWESGHTEPTYGLVRRYEDLCGIPAGQLVTAVDLVYRHDRPRVHRPHLSRPLPDDRVAAVAPLLDACLAGDVLTGADWDFLSAAIADVPDVLAPRSVWVHLLRRLLTELAASVGAPYLRRVEAVARLGGHPRARDAALEVADDLLTDPSAQVYAEAASMLAYVDHPGTAPMLQRVLRDPVSPNAVRAALFASATLLRERRADPDDAYQLVRSAHSLSTDPRQPYRVRRSAADVLLALAPDSRERIASRMRTTPEELTVASIVAGTGPMPPRVATALRGRVLAHLRHSLGPDAAEDPDLVRLLRMVTLETNDDRRSDALELLMVAPHGPAFGHAYTNELVDAASTRDMVRVHETLAALVCLAQPGNIDTPLAIAARQGSLDLGPDAAIEASWAVGNAALTAGDRRAAAAAIRTAVHDALTGVRPATPSLLEAWAYLLGRQGLLGDLDLPPTPNLSTPPTRHTGGEGLAVRAWAAWEHATRWWSDQPPYVIAAAQE
jgi:transcriptional regulator with XRE-family HTH domain